MVERNWVVRPVQFIIIHGALVVAVRELAGTGQRIDFARIDLLTDLFDQDPDVVPLGLVEEVGPVLELGHLVPHFFLVRRIEAGRAQSVGRDGVEDRHLVPLLTLDVFLEPLRLRRQDRPGEGPPRGMQGRDVAEDIIETTAEMRRGDYGQEGTRYQDANPARGLRAPVPRGLEHCLSPSLGRARTRREALLPSGPGAGTAVTDKGPIVPATLSQSRRPVHVV